MIGRALVQGAGEVRDAVTTLAGPAEWLIDSLAGGRKTHSGVHVDEESALRHAAVGACVRVVAEDMGKVPCLIYERTGPASRERADWDTYAPALRVGPNPEMTAMEYWETLTGYAMLWGRCDAYIVRKRSGAIELWPLPPNRTERVREKVPVGAPGKYTPGPVIGLNVTLNTGERRFLPWRDVLSLNAFGYDSKSPIARHRETIGLGLAGEEFGSRFFGQGGSTGGFIAMPPEATPEQADRTEARYRAKHEGLDRSHLVGILEGGAKWQEVGMPLKDAQYIDGRRFGVEEVCRIFRMQPHKIASLDRATFSNIEHQNIEYVVDTLSPWAVRHEQTIRLGLFGVKKYGRVGDRYAEFMLDALLRGDIETRYKAYALGVQFGWLNVDEIRSMENRSPLPDGKGTEHYRPLNLGVIGEELDPADEPTRKLAALLSRSVRGELPAGALNGASGDPSTLLPEVSS